MALLPILTDDNPRLRLKSQKVTKFDKNLRELSKNMLETMEAANGIGLAAPQVGLLQRLIVIDIPEDLEYDGSEHFHAVVVNPEIIKCSGEQIGEEGCLSIPGWYGEVKRYETVMVRGQDINGKPIKIKAAGLPARCLQHEIDHLDGILFTDKVVDAATLHRVKMAEPEEKTTASKAESLVKA
ncbi:MAG TPA: peptide deformylase [Chloroflexia bacterium]|nr:peptide deformylase [Chloroflexia bacterium]